VEGKERKQLLAKAVEAFQVALQVRTLQTFPLDWARTQIDLAHALRDQALTLEGQERKKLLDKALFVMNSTIDIFTAEMFPGWYAESMTWSRMVETELKKYQ
jgi:hypothetical protein